MIVEVFVRQCSFFVLVVSTQEVCVQPHDFLQTGAVVLVHAQGFRVEIMLLHKVLYLIVGLKILEMRERFRSSSELVVDLELATSLGQILQRLQVWQILSRVLLRVSY